MINDLKASEFFALMEACLNESDILDFRVSFSCFSLVESSIRTSYKRKSHAKIYSSFYPITKAELLPSLIDDFVEKTFAVRF